jgi:hypothetical protein
LVPVAVPAGIMGVCSNVSSVFQVPTKARRSFISAAGLGIAGPDAVGVADFLFFASFFSCATAEEQSSAAVNSVINVFMIHPLVQDNKSPRPVPHGLESRSSRAATSKGVARSG